MTRLAVMVAVLALGCSPKPSAEDCRKAIANMQQLMGTEHLLEPAGVESEVRRCKGGSKKKAVDCAIKAQSLEDLRACDFYKVPENAKGIGGAPAGSAGSAAPGSAGSAAPAPGSAGSAADPADATGSAGSADATGSAGSAAGSGTATP